jgi:hypothetical protein
MEFATAINFVDNAFDGIEGSIKLAKTVKAALSSDRAHKIYAIVAIAIVVTTWVLFLAGRQALIFAAKTTRKIYELSRLQYRLWIYRRRLSKAVSMPALPAAVEAEAIEVPAVEVARVLITPAPANRVALLPAMTQPVAAVPAPREAKRRTRAGKVAAGVK